MGETDSSLPRATNRIPMSAKNMPSDTPLVDDFRESGYAQPRATNKTPTSATSIPTKAPLAAKNDIVYYPKPKRTTTRSWSARPRLHTTTTKKVELSPKFSRYNRRSKRGSGRARSIQNSSDRAWARRKVERLKRKAHALPENHASGFFRHLQMEHEQKGSISVKSFKTIARCHLPLQHGELKALVLLSSATDNSPNISLKAAMLAMEKPKPVSSRKKCDVKDREYSKTLSRTVSLLEQNPCKKPQMSKLVIEENTAAAMRAMLKSRRLTDRGRRRQEFRTWIVANTVKVGKRI